MIYYHCYYRRLLKDVLIHDGQPFRLQAGIAPEQTPCTAASICHHRVSAPSARHIINVECREEAYLWDVWSLELAFAEGVPIEVGKPRMHLDIRRSTLEGAKSLVRVQDQEAPDQISQLLHTASLAFDR